MSAYHEYLYRQQRRQEMYLDRIAGNTRQFHQRYQQVLDQLVDQDLVSYVAQDFQALQQRVNRLGQLINQDPEQARDDSQNLADDVYGLRRLAQQLQRQSTRQQQQQHWQQARALHQQQQAEVQAALSAQQAAQAEQKQANEQTWQQWLQALDYVARDFALPALLKLREQVGDGELAAYHQQMQQIKAQADTQAAQWKQQQRQAQQLEIQQEVLSAHSAQMQQDLAMQPEKQAEVQQQMQALQALMAQAQSAADPQAVCAQVQVALAAQLTEVDQAITDERCRQITVQGIVQALTAQGFQLQQPPQHLVSEGQDQVLIQARRLSGRQSEFRVNLDGKFSYKFEQYEGMSCKEDMDQLLPKLQQIYGIELSDKVVKWENPDRHLRSARSMEETEQQER